ncbi:hypothetical protein NHX12_019508 [Muraenolepis orangiensis]|uniref:Phosphatidic acid phosphatase type 2/haloperoxidase domain-containing protein n=1 Tax=Muraenolepis orangiensis TaxID=630683 RepID=A0A9Q0IX98_9TELE|nr:hypothetical protein NHX12_019508 [Muraenolepis orangiensis]
MTEQGKRMMLIVVDVLSVFVDPAMITSGEAYLVYSKRLYSNSQFNQYLSALYKVVGTFLFGAAVSQSLTDIAKFTIGRPRPNFLSVCAPLVCNGYMPQINCTGGKWTRLVRPTIQFFLVAFALFVGYSRVSDYKHHWSDVLVGLLQGALIACLTVRYVSDFFKHRRPQCMAADEAEDQHQNMERKPGPQPPDGPNSNHHPHPQYNYSGPV